MGKESFYRDANENKFEIGQLNEALSLARSAKDNYELMSVCIKFPIIAFYMQYKYNVSIDFEKLVEKLYISEMAADGEVKIVEDPKKTIADTIGLILIYANYYQSQKLKSIICANIDSSFLSPKGKRLMTFYNKTVLGLIQGISTQLEEELSAGEMLLFMCSFFMENNMQSKAKNLEFMSMYMKISFDYSYMKLWSVERQSKYYNDIIGSGSISHLADHCRKIDVNFDDYEEWFGKSREQFIDDALSMDGADPYLTYRFSRGFYSDDTVNEWLRKVKANVKDKDTVKWCEFYTLLVSWEERIEYCEEKEFLEAFRDELSAINGIVESGIVLKSSFEHKKIFYPLGIIFLKAFNKGFDVYELINVLGKTNVCAYDRNQGYFKDIYEEIYRNDIEAMIRSFEAKLKEGDLERTIFLYMNTPLHQLYSLRNLVENVANYLLASGCQHNEVSSQVAKLFSSYSFKGVIRRIDKEYAFEGLYSVEAVNVYTNSEHIWQNIQRKYTGKERREYSSLLYRLDYESGIGGPWRFLDKDSTLFFKITGCKTLRTKKYDNCLILIGELEPDIVDGIPTGKRVDDEVAINEALDLAVVWLHNMTDTEWVDAAVDDRNLKKKLRRENRVNEYEDKHLSLEPPMFQMFVEPSTVNRTKEFAFLILDTYMALMEDKYHFDIFARMISVNFIDRLNEFFYKPGISNRYTSLKLNKKERFMLVDKARTILDSKISTQDKMLIYMNTCLKNVFYLEHFVRGLKREDKPFLYRETNEFMYYTYPVKYEATEKDRYRLSFKGGIASTLRDKLFIDIDKVPGHISQNIENRNDLFAEIYYIKTNKCIEVYQLITKKRLSEDSNTLLRRALNDLKQVEESNMVEEGIREALSQKAKLKTDSQKRDVVNRIQYIFNQNGYDISYVWSFFEKWIQENDILSEELNVSSNLAMEHLMKLIDANDLEDNITILYLFDIHKNTYYNSACSKEELIAMIREKNEFIPLDRLSMIYDNNPMYNMK